MVRPVSVSEDRWYLTMDRTNWQFGRTDINLLALGIAHRGIAIPLFRQALDKPGNSNTAERIALLERFIAVFGVGKIADLPADCEFVGKDWFQWLQQQQIPFHQRIKCDTLIPNTWNKPTQAGRLFGSLKIGQRSIWRDAAR
jgi:hypothetical protein